MGIVEGIIFVALKIIETLATIGLAAIGTGVILIIILCLRAMKEDSDDEG